MALFTRSLDLRTTCEVLGRANSKRFRIGIQLGISRSKLLELEKGSEPLSGILDYWLKGNVDNPACPVSWSTIVTALKSDYVGESKLSEKIRKRYCKKPDRPKGGDDDDSSSLSDSSNLDSDVELDLEQLLDLNARQIQKKYAFYVDSIQTLVEEKGVTPEILNSFLLNLPASVDGERELKLLIDLKDELMSAEDVVDIFITLSSRYASFLNPDIYNTILANYGTIDERQERDYPEHLKDFIVMHKIKEFVKMNPRLVNPKLHKHGDNSKKLRIKFDLPTTQSLRTLKEVTGAVANILGLRASTLRLYGVEKGRVLVTLLFPTSVADALFTESTEFSSDQRSAFRAASVKWLECNGFRFYFRERKTNPAAKTDDGGAKTNSDGAAKTDDGTAKTNDDGAVGTSSHSEADSATGGKDQQA